ncbi:hypothetical protein [Bradyrhizobium septentrionale]|uniref:Uncharacterized protein n=1 Tax=Bradyrhizobium septentrionale TaxID=1404411 RepID=A0A973W829_9BRAD|nr:hypothetical protein [Bradyrhizobium septentrionale]UGY17731.1 hypothetical protein HAP48_0010045 [Bradyrhizobium septentrionale]UGY26466.1 hypothetical protein HU675_0006760 [Bradyrhizobium septentrionale]
MSGGFSPGALPGAGVQGHHHDNYADANEHAGQSGPETLIHQMPEFDLHQGKDEAYDDQRKNYSYNLHGTTNEQRERCQKRDPRRLSSSSSEATMHAPRVFLAAQSLGLPPA